MIDLQQATRIARDVRRDANPSGVLANDDLYVFGFDGDDKMANLPVAVHRHTGEADTLSADEYTDISHTLRPLE